MGLDMYAFSFEREQLKNPDAPFGIEVNVPENQPRPEPARQWYWRKFNHLHGWMERLYEARGGTETFNCVTLRLTSEDLDRLEADMHATTAKNGEVIKGEPLTPTSGFFFGGDKLYPEDLESLASFITEARAELAAGRVVFYDSWW